MEWQPMETAPKQESVLGVWSYFYHGDKSNTTGVEIIYIDNKGDVHTDEGICHPNLYTHWMPLPEPPVLKQPDVPQQKDKP